jgi:hypothetical protein
MARSRDAQAQVAQMRSNDVMQDSIDVTHMYDSENPLANRFVLGEESAIDVDPHSTVNKSRQMGSRLGSVQEEIQYDPDYNVRVHAVQPPDASSVCERLPSLRDSLPSRHTRESSRKVPMRRVRSPPASIAVGGKDSH